MADPISFDPFLGWVDTTDPNNIPPDVRTINAADLLRYENLGVDAADRINDLSAEVAAAAIPEWDEIIGKPTTFAPSTHTHTGDEVAAATTTAPGTLSAADKAKLDNASAALVVNALVKRDPSGLANFATPVTSSNAATKGYVDDLVAVKHSEWTSSISVPQTTGWGPGTMTRDAAMSANDSFVSSPGADRFTFAAGVYAISLHAVAPGVITNGSHIQFKNDAGTVVLFEGMAAPDTSWWIHLNIPNFRVAESTTYRFRFYNTGAAQTWDSRLRITKLK